MQPKAPYLEVQQLAKKFGKTLALDYVSLQILPGEFVFLLGPSGCGKTTLLRLIAGLESPSAGVILQGGRDVTRTPPSQRDFGIVFQSYALFPNLTVAANIAYGLQGRKLPAAKIEEKVQQLLALVGLQGYDRRFPAQLSGGQQQRVALARALAIEPGLLLLDEPLSALDARVRAGLRLEIASLQRQLGVTTIMVTHDQEEALTMADRIIVMDQGHIVQCGTPLQIYQNPATPFVADFVGIMNFLPGVVTGEAHAQVRCGAERLHVLPWDQSHSPGAEVTLAIRPEELQVVNDAAVVHNVVTAHVHAVEFTGPLYRMHVQLPFAAETGQPVRMTAYVPLSARQVERVTVGRHVPLYLPPQALRVFPAHNQNGTGHGC